MRISYLILMIIALTFFPTPRTMAETIEVRANATVRDYIDDQGATGDFTKAGDPVVILLTYDNSVSNSSMISEVGHYDFDARLGSFSISVGDFTWQHDFSLGDLKAKVFNDFEPPSPPCDRFEVSGSGVNEKTFPFAQAGKNYFNLQFNDKDGSMFDSFELPDDQTQIDVASLKVANGIVEARNADSDVVWSFQYDVGDVSISRVPEPEISLLLSITTLLVIAFALCATFLLVVAFVAYLIPNRSEQEEGTLNSVPRDGE